MFILELIHIVSCLSGCSLLVVCFLKFVGWRFRTWEFYLANGFSV